jgi:hypothetical protein
VQQAGPLRTYAVIPASKSYEKKPVNAQKEIPRQKTPNPYAMLVTNNCWCKKQPPPGSRLEYFKFPSTGYVVW